MLNRVELIGHLTATPELHYASQGTAYCHLQLSTNRYSAGQQHTDYHTVTAYSSLAERCANYLGLGSLVYVDARLESPAQSEHGTSLVLGIVAYRVQFLSRRPTGSRESRDADSRPSAPPQHIRHVIEQQSDGPTEVHVPVEDPA